MAIEETVAVGKVSKIYGQNGRLSLSLYDTFPQDFSIEEPLFVIIDALAVPLFCDMFTRRGKAGAIAEFADFDNEFRAGELVGKELLMLGFDTNDGGQIDDPDRLYLEDMVGWRVIIENLAEQENQQATNGKIVDFIEGQNPLFEIELDDQTETLLIPAVEEFMVDIDTSSNILTVNLPEGLLDLN
ncbi:MAG: hypothetical protein R3Y15_06145 [Rikenellaceae bacterium]